MTFLLDMHIGFSLDRVSHNIMPNFELSRKISKAFTVGVAFTQFLHLVFSKRVIRACGFSTENPVRMQVIFSACDVLKVVDMVVGWIAVLMVYFKSFRTRPEKGFGYNSVNEFGGFEVRSSQSDHAVSNVILLRGLSEYSSDLSPSAGRVSANASKVRDRVNALESDYRFPLFFHTTSPFHLHYGRKVA